MNKFFAGSILILFSCLSSCSLIKHSTGKRHKIGSIKQSDTAIATQNKPHAFIGPLFDNAKDSASTHAISAEKKKLIESLKPLWQKEYNYTTFSGKARMHYEEGDNQKEFTAHIRVRKDSVIWVNITVLGGFQVARILITTDSLEMINYIDREVVTMALIQATKLLPAPADFSTLQNFIVGQALRKSGVVSDAGDIGTTLSIQIEDSDYIQQIAYNKSDSTMKSGQMSTHKPNGPQGVIQYSNYAEIKDKKFSFGRSLHLQNAGVVYVLDMDFSNVDFDTGIDFPFSIPKNYTINPRK